MREYLSMTSSPRLLVLPISKPVYGILSFLFWPSLFVERTEVVTYVLPKGLESVWVTERGRAGFPDGKSRRTLGMELLSLSEGPFVHLFDV